jgi:hypothetical protein
LLAQPMQIALKSLALLRSIKPIEASSVCMQITPTYN